MTVLSVLKRPFRALGARWRVEQPLPQLALPPPPQPEPVIDALAPDQIIWKTLAEAERLIGPLTSQVIAARYGHDAWLHNYIRSIREYVDGEVRMTAYPWNMTLGITSTCNAKCTFCSVPMRRTMAEIPARS